MEEVFERLRKRLADLATGFPPSKSQVEMKMLKKLFTEEEAELFLGLSPFLNNPEEVAIKSNRDPAKTAETMETMAQKGLLFRQRKGESVRYSAVPFVPGILEFQVTRLDKELARDLEVYKEGSYFLQSIQSFKTPVMRTIPIKRDLVAQWPIAPFEDALKIIEDQEVIAVAPCLCRTLSQLNDKSCGKPLETCFMGGANAHFYVENGMGRYIDKEEAKEIILQNEKAGLVMSPFNSQKVRGMCSCCGDCCEMLGSLKKQPSPAAAVQSNYFAMVNSEDCIGCEACLDRCQMEAIEMVDDKSVILTDRCIGCGLCVTTCPQEALRLVKKPEDQCYLPPATQAETFIRIAMERNKI